MSALSLEPALLAHLLSFLPPPVPSQVSATSRAFRSAASDEALWRRACSSVWAGKQLARTRRALLTDCEDGGDVGVAGRGWKEAFRDAWVDARRTVITESELCALGWIVFFTSMWSGPVVRRGFFLPDRTYNNAKPEYTTILPWSIDPQGWVTIGDFPPLKPSRAKDWGWILMNEDRNGRVLATYVSFQPPDGEDVGALLEGLAEGPHW